MDAGEIEWGVTDVDELDEFKGAAAGGVGHEFADAELVAKRVGGGGAGDGGGLGVDEVSLGVVGGEVEGVDSGLEGDGDGPVVGAVAAGTLGGPGEF